jgi:uncharacterized membrane protein YphA (DoxX/SURF4 family)
MPTIDESLIKAGRSFYGVCMAALGIQQLFYASFRSVFLPPWPAGLAGLTLCAYLASAILIVAGIAIVVETKARAVALVLGGILLVLFGFCHVPYMIFVNPYSSHLGAWTDPFKELALAGGAFVVAGSFPEAKANGDRSLLLRLLETLIPVGGIFFSLTMIAFGIDHFLYTEIAAKLVPAWIPGHTFWTYFSGVALIGAGVGIITRIKLKVVGMLLGTMIFLWFVLLHIPRAIADPFVGKGNEVTSAFEALGFSGIAFVLAYGVRRREKVSSS